MTDLVNYITHNRPELPYHPQFQELVGDLEVGVLDYADDCLSRFRQADRLADAMADPRWSTYDGVPLEAIPPIGTRVIDEWWQIGTVEQLDTNVYGEQELVVSFGCNAHSRTRFRDPIKDLRQWVPIPLDAATLGDLPTTPPPAATPGIAEV